MVNKHIDIDIEDECGGLLSEKEIFQPFIQGNENQKGLGLGLTIAHRAIFLCHGTIEVHNLPGKGCIFKFTLPKKADSERLDAKSVA